MDKKNRLNIKNKILLSGKPAKQLTFDNLPNEPTKKPDEGIIPQNKQIIITKINSKTGENELALEIDFKLTPAKDMFSKIAADLHFDDKKVKSVLLDILHSFVSTDEFQLRATLDLNGISAGSHIVKAEMYEPSFSGEKHCHFEKEVTIEYVPEDRKSRLRRIPSLKRVDGQGIAVVSDSEKELYREIGEMQKKEAASSRDEW